MRSVSRRSVLAGSVVVAGGTVLGACTGSSSKGGGGGANASAGSGSSASAPSLNISGCFIISLVAVPVSGTFTRTPAVSTS